MSQQSDQTVQVEIQKTLALINDTTLKIKKELTAINDLVRENGRLNTVVDNANAVLSNIARDMGMKQRPIDGEDNEDESENFRIPVTSDFITEKLMAIIHNSDQS